MKKCLVSIKSMIDPVPGSIQTDLRGVATGTCPACRTPGVLLTITNGTVRDHVVSPTAVPENNPTPPTLTVKEAKRGKGMSEPIVDLVDTGLRIGDPRSAEQRRVAELNGVTGNGTVQIPKKVPGSGKTKSGAPRMVTKLTDVPATEENVRTALEYWRKRTPRSDAGRKRQNDQVSAHVRMLESIMAAQVCEFNPTTRRLDVVGTTDASVRAQLSDAAFVHRGPTLVQGRDVPTRVRNPELPFTEPTDLRRDGSVRLMTTVDQPRGRDRFDKMITDVPEPPRKRTASERRRYRRQQAAKGNGQ